MLHWPENTRSVELLLASVMIGFGIVYLLPGDTLSIPSYEWLMQFVRIFPGSEAAFGALLLVLGVARFCAVLVNGYWKPNAILRFFGCLVGSLFWASLILSFVSADTGYVPAMVAFLIPSIALESYSAARSAKDAFEQDSLGIRRRARVRQLYGHR